MFEYTVIRSNRKTLSVIIERDKRVIVRAPEDISEDRIMFELQKRKRLIEKKINSDQKFNNDYLPKEFESGEQFLYLGKYYTLEINFTHEQSVYFGNGIQITAINKANAKSILLNWYKQKAIEILTPRILFFAEHIGVKRKKINITDAKYTWGTCTPSGNLNFNWRLIKAPLEVIDYIVIHELSHLRESNHSPEFWNIVGVQMPNYEEAKGWLKEYGNLLDEDF
jgi:predicted metal-dependent hydrolase